MPQTIKYIEIQDSPLYGLARKRDVSNLLGISPSELNSLLSDNNFKEWIKKEKGKKDRLIEEPYPPLSVAIAKLHGHLSVIKTPDYLLSGKKGIKPRDNAEVHRLNGFMLNVDIEKFYQSTKREFVYRVFYDDFKMSSDVASVMADLVTYKGHIPTGAAVSQLIAYWAYKKTFDRIHKLCLIKGITMSVWVDDITFSSPNPLPRNLDKTISDIFRKVDLFLKPNKTKSYRAHEHKTATGSAISPAGNILVKNQKRKEILDILRGKRIENLSLAETRTIFGKLTSQRQNENAFFQTMYARCKIRLRKLQKRAASKIRR